MRSHRIHIVGVNPRTGTTLLAECMRLCFDVALAEEHEAPLHRLRRCQGTYLTKRPRDLQWIGSRLLLDPRFFAICMVRDPRDTVVSEHRRRPGKYYKNASIANFKANWRFAKRHANHPRFLWLKYEDLIARPDEMQSIIATRLPFLQRRARFSEFHLHGEVSWRSERAMNGVRAIDPLNRGKWTEHLQRLQDQLDEFGPIDDELVELGYEVDGDWAGKHGIVRDQSSQGEGAASASVRKYQKVEWRYLSAAILAGAYAKLRVPRV